LNLFKLPLDPREFVADKEDYRRHSLFTIDAVAGPIHTPPKVQEEHMMRVEVKPAILQWAIERAGDRATTLYERFPKLGMWQRGDVQPTLKQLESFAKAAYLPVGYFFLAEPPDESLPIPDMRTVGGRGVQRPSPDLLDVIYLCQRRQSWYQDYADSIGEEPRAFVGSVRITNSADRVAADIMHRLDFSIDRRRECNTWEEALRLFVRQAESIGVLVMISGVVGSNTHRVLEPDEFRGFALADKLAPLVFINGADTKAAQMFTLAHELAHIWLGQSALTDVTPASSPTHNIETWCNRVAAEFLVPLKELRRELATRVPLESLSALARKFKVSTLVILRRLLDAGAVSRNQFDKAYAAELAKFTAPKSVSGGDFYLTQPIRLSRRFARAVITSTLEGQTLFRDAFQMLCISKEKMFRQLGESLEVLH
jgi:Zn-dependent peptidase ImmA (M78 family)